MTNGKLSGYVGDGSGLECKFYEIRAGSRLRSNGKFCTVTNSNRFGRNVYLITRFFPKKPQWL